MWDDCEKDSWVVYKWWHLARLMIGKLELMGTGTNRSKNKAWSGLSGIQNEEIYKILSRNPEDWNLEGFSRKLCKI